MNGGFSSPSGWGAAKRDAAKTTTERNEAAGTRWSGKTGAYSSPPLWRGEFPQTVDSRAVMGGIELYADKAALQLLRGGKG